MERRNWTRDELILAVNLYCKIPFGKIHQNNPDIIKLAGLIGLTPGALAWKMVNFANIDPSLDRKGASHVAKMDVEIWNEFFNNWERLAYESEILLTQIENKASFPVKVDELREGLDKERMVKTRVNQSFFRKTVLSSYDFQCCITGIKIPQVLIASHIVPWSKDEQNRLNPRNGLCLNALHDKAFDLGLITISDDEEVIVSSKIKKDYNREPEKKFILSYDGCKIKSPTRFKPEKDFIKYHRDVVFENWV